MRDRVVSKKIFLLAEGEGQLGFFPVNTGGGGGVNVMGNTEANGKGASV